MRHRTSSQAKQIEAEYAARRQQAYRDWQDQRAMREATSLVERELGGVEIASL